MAAGVVGCPSSVVDGLRRIWCASESGDSLPRLKCAQMTCPNCKTGRLKLEKDLLNNAKSNPVTAHSVVYYEWKNVPCPDNEDAFRVQRSQETMSLRRLLTMFLDSVVALSMHVFVVTWQWIQFQDLKKHLRPGTLVTVRDFAQNYLNTFQDEPSGAHWDHEQTTIFPIVNWYRCPKASCDSVMMHEQVFITPQSQKHDHFAVAAFVKESLRDLKERFGVWIKDIVNWSDNCRRQFKSHGPIGPKLLAKQSFNLLRISSTSAMTQMRFSLTSTNPTNAAIILGHFISLTSLTMNSGFPKLASRTQNPSILFVLLVHMGLYRHANCPVSAHVLLRLFFI